MSWITALREHLVTDVTITAFIGVEPNARVFPDAAPTDTDKPYIVLERISATSGHNYAGANGLVTHRVQIDVWGNTKTEVINLGERIRQRNDGFFGDMGTENLPVQFLRLEDRDDRLSLPNRGSEEITYRIRFDYFMTHAESVPTFS